MIGILNAETAQIKAGADGELYMILRVSPESRYAAKMIAADIRQGKKKSVVSFKQYRNNRTLKQNRLLWELLEMMAAEMGTDAWNCYITLIEQTGAKFDYFYCLPKTYDTFKSHFRATKIVQTDIVSGAEMYLCKCFYGSSKMNTQEMTQLIDAAFDILADIGVDAGRSRSLSYLWQEWGEIK